MRVWLLRLLGLALLGSLAVVEAGSQERQPASPPAATDQAAAEPPAPVTAPAPPAAGDAKGPVPAIAASQLDTFLLRDSKGNLVPVLGLSFEEFEQLWRQKRGLAPPLPPGYVLDALSLSGSLQDNAARLQVVATIRLRDEGWQRVPLLMEEAALVEPASFEGSGEHLLTVDDEAGGYVCWLKGGAGTVHIVTFPIAANVTASGDERRLAIRLPRATEASLRLTVPGRVGGAELATGEGLVTTRGAADRTELTVLGPAGDVQLAWSQSRAPRASGPTQLDASGEILVRVESEYRITSDARLRVRSYGAPLESFRVRLPAGMELLPLPPAGGYSVHLVEPAETAAARGRPTAGQIVELRLDRPATTAMEFRLVAQLQSDGAAGAALMPARFEVLSAVRQRGQIDFTVDGQWQLEWKEDKSVHRLDLTPDTAAARIVARFEYFRQPCGLELKVAARPSRVSVEPTHMVFVDPQQVRVETLLKYRFRGARAAGVEFEMGDWQFDRLTPDSLLELPAASGSPSAGGQREGEVRIPFRAEVAPPSEVELKLEAHRKLPSPTDRLVVTFPRPIADLVAPATVVIFPADNVELTPQIFELIGLSPDPTTVRLPGRQQPPLVYRDVGGGEETQFVAQMRIRARSTSASALATMRVERHQVQVQQRLDYRVAHEPQRTFLLTAPRELLAPGNVQVWFEGEPLAINPASQRAGAGGRTVEFEFSTPTDKIGAFAIDVRYSVPLSLSGEEPTPFALPLVLPAAQGDFQFGGQRAVFVLAERLQIEPDPDESDEITLAPAAESGSTDAYTWPQPAGLTYWLIGPARGSLGAAVQVSQAWIQTWLTWTTRQERVAYRLTTAHPAVRVRLPSGVRRSALQAAVDGHETELAVRGPRMAVVSIPAAARERPCVLELWYTIDAPSPWLGMVRDRLQPAEIDDAVAPRRTYWQLGLPEDQQLVIMPDDMAAEMAWAADRWPLARRPVMDQRQLEAWIKASGQDRFPLGTSEYLFGALGRWPTLGVTIVQRRLLVGACSAAALVLGLVLLHVPQARSVTLLVVGAVAAAGLAAAAPDTALRLAQAATIGVLVFAATAAWSRVTLPRVIAPAAPLSTFVPRPRDSVSSSGSAVRKDRSARVPAGGSVATAALEVKP